MSSDEFVSEEINFYVVIHELQSAGCWGTSLGPVYNPSNASLACQVGKSARMKNCPVGDVSGKWGVAKMTNVTTVYQFSDPNLPLFGHNSLVGRSVGLWAGLANVNEVDYEYADPETCAELRLVNETMTYARVKLGGPFSKFSGTVVMSQPEGFPSQDTTIGVTLHGNTFSTGHQWEIHEHKTGLFSSCNRVVRFEYSPTNRLLDSSSLRAMPHAST